MQLRSTVQREAAAPVDDGARLDRVRRVVAERNRLDAEPAAAVRDADVHRSAEHDGLKSMRSWLRSHTRLSGGAIGQLAGTAPRSSSQHRSPPDLRRR